MPDQDQEQNDRNKKKLEKKSKREKKEKITRKTNSETEKIEKDAVKGLINPKRKKQDLQDDAAEIVEDKEISIEIFKTFEFEKYQDSISSLKKGFEKMQSLDSVSEKFVLGLRRELMVFNELASSPPRGFSWFSRIPHNSLIFMRILFIINFI